MADTLKNFKVNGVEHTLDYETGLSNKPTIPTTVEELSDSGNYVKLENGLVPNNVLPSYVDDVLEYANFSSFPATGEVGKIYVDIETNFTYRWSGSTYIQIGGKDTADLEIALGDLESEINELQGNQFSGSYNDLTDKPTIPTKNSWNYDDRYVKYNVTQSLTETQKGTARANIGAGTSNFSGSYNDLTDKPTIPTGTSQLTNDSGFITDSALTPYALNSNLTSEVDRLDARINAITGGGEGEDVPTLDNVYTQTQVNNLLANKVDNTITVNGHALSENVTVTKSDLSLNNVTNDAQVKRSEMGAANGVATLDSNGKVPTAQLPSYVDDVIEGTYVSSTSFKNTSGTVITGETGKIYVDTTTNKTYRWSGSTYVEISSSLALGETASTAYAGDKGAANATNITNIINGTTEVPKATQATKVGTDTIGDTNTPIYLNAGVPTKLGFTIAKSVPSEAKFTDTTYSTATSSTAGLVKIGYSANDKNYAVKLNSSGQMYVNVPWENTQGTDTGATSITTTGSGNAVTSASYDSSTRKITLTKGTSFLSLSSGGTVSGPVTATKFTEGELLLTRKYGTLLPFGTQIGKNVNLNTTTYIKVGNYFCSANTTVETLTNCPTTDAFMMQVYSPLATSFDNESTGKWIYRLRKLLTYAGNEYIQQVYSGNTAGTFTYGAWKKIAKTEDLSNYLPLSGGNIDGSLSVRTSITATSMIASTYCSSAGSSGAMITQGSSSSILTYVRSSANAGNDTYEIATKADLSNYMNLTDAQTVGGMKTFSGGITIGSAGGITIEGVLQIKNGISALSSSTSTTYSKGSSGQVLKSNGSGVYWASDSNNTTYAASGDTSSKIFLIGRTSQSTSGGTTYSHDTVYVDTSGRICGTAGVYTNKLVVPTTSGGSTYGVGSAGQVLTSNGSTSYWATPSSSSGSVTYEHYICLSGLGDYKMYFTLYTSSSTPFTAGTLNTYISGRYYQGCGYYMGANGPEMPSIGFYIINNRITYSVDNADPVGGASFTLVSDAVKAI